MAGGATEESVKPFPFPFSLEFGGSLGLFDRAPTECVSGARHARGPKFEVGFLGPPFLRILGLWHPRDLRGGRAWCGWCLHLFLSLAENFPPVSLFLRDRLPRSLGRIRAGGPPAHLCCLPHEPAWVTPTFAGRVSRQRTTELTCDQSPPITLFLSAISAQYHPHFPQPQILPPTIVQTNRQVALPSNRLVPVPEENPKSTALRGHSLCSEFD